MCDYLKRPILRCLELLRTSNCSLFNRMMKHAPGYCVQNNVIDACKFLEQWKVMSNCSQIRSPNLLIKLQVLKVHEFLKWSPGLNNVKIRFNFVKYHRKIYRSSIISFSLLIWWVVGLHFLASITPRTFIYGKMVYNFTLSTTTNGFPTFNANKARFKVLSPIVISSW